MLRVDLLFSRRSQPLHGGNLGNILRKCYVILKGFSHRFNNTPKDTEMSTVEFS